MNSAKRQYYVRMGLAILIYVVLLGVTTTFTSAFPDAVWRFPVALVPMAPFVYAVASVVKYLQMVDELERRVQLEALAIAFGATATVTFGYGFLEHVGLPHINWWFVWPVMGTAWILGLTFVERRYR